MAPSQAQPCSRDNMLVNERTAIVGSSVVLVPYRSVMHGRTASGDSYALICMREFPLSMEFTIKTDLSMSLLVIVQFTFALVLTLLSRNTMNG